VPVWEHVASVADPNALESIANFKSGPSRVKATIFERVAPFAFLLHNLLTPGVLTTANSSISSDFAVCSPNDPEQVEEAFRRLGFFLKRPELYIIFIAC
jgi:hypothetical protein